MKKNAKKKKGNGKSFKNKGEIERKNDGRQ